MTYTHLMGRLGREVARLGKVVCCPFREQARDRHLGAPRRKAEFDAWRWTGMAELEGVLVPFKRAVYRGVIAAFRHLAA